MEQLSLQLQGSPETSLLAALLAAVTLAMAGWGVVQLVARRWRYGTFCLAAAFGLPLALPVLLIDALRNFAGGNTRSGRSSLLAAGAILLVSAGAVACALAAGANTLSVLMALLCVQVILTVGVFYSAVYFHLGAGRMTALMALRCMAILALLLILFKPALSMTNPAARPYLEVLVDRSASMATVDDGNSPDRYAYCLLMLTNQQGRLEKSFQPVWHHFAQSLQSAGSLAGMSELKAAGDDANGTNIAMAIRSAAAEYPRADLAGVVLLSDGNHNAGDSCGDAAVEAGAPIYTVAVGSLNEKMSGRKNVQLLNVEAPIEAVMNNVATVKAGVKISGYPQTPVPVRLIDDLAAGPLTEQVLAQGNVFTGTASFHWTPRDAASTSTAPTGAAPLNSNVRKIRVVAGPMEGQAVSDENETEVHMLMASPRIRVLYIEGSIRPEYRSLKRFLETDPNVEFMGLIRLSANQFWAQGGIGGKKLDALPSGDEDFKLFDVIILGDVDRSFLSAAQMARIRQFVNDGGGLIMLGGHNSFGPGGYADTDIEKALPVVLGGKGQPQESIPFVPQLTAAGQVNPVFEGITGYFAGPDGVKADAKLPALPDLLGCVSVASAKPAATVLAVHPSLKNSAGPPVVLAVQQFGAGRSAAFTADTTWQWDAPMKALGQPSPYQRFWGQLIRWLAGVETKARAAAPAVVLRLESCHAQVGDTIKVIARVQDAKGLAAQSAQVNVSLIADDGKGGPLDTQPLTSAGKGLFEGTLTVKKEGKFRLQAVATDGDKTLGQDDLPLAVTVHYAEMDRLARNDAVLQMIAEKSGGKMTDLQGLPDLVSTIIDRQKSRAGPAPQARYIRLYNFTLLFLAFVALLTAEWILRRKWQLQ